MTDASSDVLTVQVVAGDGDDTESLTDLAAALSDELLELDVDAVQPIADDDAPEGAKGPVGAIGAWLAVHLGPAALRSVVDAIAGWATRNNKTVQITLGANTLALTGASAEVQQRVVDEFFARIPPLDG